MCDSAVRLFSRTVGLLGVSLICAACHAQDAPEKRPKPALPDHSWMVTDVIEAGQFSPDYVGSLAAIRNGTLFIIPKDPLHESSKVVLKRILRAKPRKYEWVGDFLGVECILTLRLRDGRASLHTKVTGDMNGDEGDMSLRPVPSAVGDAAIEQDKRREIVRSQK